MGFPGISGTTSLVDLQVAAALPRRHRQRSHIRRLDRSRSPGERPRLCAASVAGQPLVDGSLPSEQFGRLRCGHLSALSQRAAPSRLIPVPRPAIPAPRGRRRRRHRTNGVRAPAPRPIPMDPTMPCVENRLNAFDQLDPPAPRSGQSPNGSADDRAGAGIHLSNLRPLLPDRPARLCSGCDCALDMASATPRSLGLFVRRRACGRAVSQGLPDQRSDKYPTPARQRPARHGCASLEDAKAGPTVLSALKGLGGACQPEQLADPSVGRHAEEVVRDTGLVDTLVGLSKCPDYVVNRGHDFGASLAADDRKALIAYLKQF